MAKGNGGANAIDLEALVRRSVAGEREAIHELVQALQGDLFGLSLRMLANREEAEDATQEILVRIVTRLARFDGRSSVRTWAYRVAVNCILDMKKSAAERLHLSFERLAEGLSEIPSQDAPLESEHSLLVEEVKVGCTLGMLQCLDRAHRLAFILGEILETPGPEAAEILGIPPHLFRKRLQMARSSILAFTRAYCGLASDQAPCRCNRRVPGGLQAGRLTSEDCRLATKQTSFEQARAIIRQVGRAQWALQVHRTSQPRGSSVDFAKRILQTLEPHVMRDLPQGIRVGPGAPERPGRP